MSGRDDLIVAAEAIGLTAEQCVALADRYFALDPDGGASVIGEYTVNVTPVVDRAAVQRAREHLAAALSDCIADPVLVAEVVARVMETGPLVRYIADGVGPDQ